MRGKRSLGRYTLRSYATTEFPREYAVLVRHRDTGDQWMLRLSPLRPFVSSIDEAERAIHTLTIDEVEALVAETPPMSTNLPTVRRKGSS